MGQPVADQAVMTVGDISAEAIVSLLDRFDIHVTRVADNTPITGSFWGDPEAGIIGRQVFVRRDTPVHSLLHEVCHIVCMTPERRDKLNCDAGGDDIEEAAVCYLQIVLADFLPGVGRERLMQDMDAWGYSFRLGTTKSWLTADADDAQAWLRRERLLDSADVPAFRLRGP
ncbi:MAG: hypothetical protein ACR2QR_13345 [Woeseiaceae bacterium]